MKKVLLATTCAAALSVFAWTAGGVSFAQQSTGGGATQQNQNMGGASDQQNERKAAPNSQEKRPGGAMSGAQNENREQTPRANAAEQRENTQPGKAGGAMERHTPTTAEEKQPTEKGRMQSGQANERERMRNGAANANEKPGTATERSRSGENAQQRPNEGRAAAEQQNGGAAATGANGATGRNEMGQRLDPKQATEFRSRLEKHGEIARASVNFDARVGVAVPETVQLTPIPTDIVAEYPEFRGYDVTIVRDQVVIVDPHTRNVVEVIRQGGTNAAEARPRRERLHLTREQDEVIRRNVHIEHPADVEFDERVDERVPDSVALIPMPGPVVADIPEVRSYDYFVDRSDHVVIVDPETHEVVGIVEQ